MLSSSSPARRLSRWMLAGAAIALGAGVEGTARAEPDRLALRWVAPEGCPSEAEVKAEVDRFLGAGAARPPRPIPVSAVVSREDQGSFRVRLETPGDGAPRVREVRGATCAVIARTTALILAMMIDPSAVEASPARAADPKPAPSPPPPVAPQASAPAPSTPPPSASAPSAPAPSAPAPSAPALSASAPSTPAPSTPAPSTPAPGMSAAVIAPPRAPAPQARPIASPPPRAVAPPASPPWPPPPRAPSSPPTPLSFGLLLWAGADAGSLPRIAADLGATAALIAGRQRFEIGASIWPSRTANVTTRAGGKVDLVAGSVGTCRDLLGRLLQVGPCLAFELGRLHAAGFGVSAPGEASEIWAAVRGGGMLAWSPLRWFALSLRLDAAVPIARPRFVLSNVGAVYRPSAVVGRAAAGVEIRF